MIKYVTLLLVTVTITSCGLQEIDSSILNLGPITIETSNEELRNDFNDELNRLQLSNDLAVTIVLAEDNSITFPSFETRGHANKRELRYILRYEVKQNGETIINSDYNYNQVFDNNETKQRANQLANQRFFQRARNEGINNLIIHLQNYFNNGNL